MKYVKSFKVIICFTCVLFITLLFPFGNTLVVSASPETNEINIITSPEKILFDLTNLKPGDWAERTVVVTNKGEQDFNYLTTSSLKKGSEKLYNVLLLTISDNSKEIFHGKLSEFRKLESRLIASGQAEELFFKITFPTDLGNDFQGLWCEVEFKYFVEGTLGGVIPVDGPKLPVTGTNMFNYIVAGVVLMGAGGMLLLYLRKRKLKTND